MKEKFLKMSQKQQVLSVQELPKRQSDSAFFDERVREMETAVSRDPFRAEAFRLREDIDSARAQAACALEELDGPQLSEGERREMLLAARQGRQRRDRRAREDVLRVAAGDPIWQEAAVAVRRTMEKYDANDPKAQKYQELFQRDKEMSELIDSFEPTKARRRQDREGAGDDRASCCRARSRDAWG